MSPPPSASRERYSAREFFLDLLRIEFEQTIRRAGQQFDSKRVGEQLEQTQLWDVVEYPRMRAESWGSKIFIDATDSNAGALARLTAANQEAAVVVDSKGGYAGIVRRSLHGRRGYQPLRGHDEATPSYPDRDEHQSTLLR